ncbi:MAG: TfoX/Sxy family protein [Alphaproteobacteria bacterium]|nr:TfoX/Sxy family protein [Alphaproteobacteria bacterium]
MASEYCEYILDLMSPHGDVTAKRMFGGYGLYRNGLIFAIIADDALYFKVGDSNRADYEAAGMRPFSYAKKDREVALTSYWHVPLDVLEDEEMLGAWIDKAEEVSHGKAAAKVKKKERL